MIKLIAIDLDGTLYTSDHKISANNLSAVQRARENDLLPVIVTGRGRRGAEDALEILKMDLPYICSAGALLRTGLTGENLQIRSFHAHAELQYVIKFARDHNTSLIGETPQGRPYWFGPDSMSTAMDPLTAQEAYQSIRSFNPEKDFDQPMLKVTLVADQDLLARAETIIRENCPSIHQVYSGIQYIDLTANGVNKGSALSALAAHLQLTRGQIAAIGDQGIDLQMLQFAGYPIAMANAVQPLRQAAKWIAPSNDADGVAWAIDEILRHNQQTSH